MASRMEPGEPDEARRGGAGGALGERTRRGAHRARPEPLRLLVPVVALAAVLVAGAVALSGDDDGPRTTTAATRTQDRPATPAPTTAPAPSTAPAPPTAATAEPRESPSPDQSSEPTDEPTEEATDEPAGDSERSDGGEIPVVVLNQTSVTGLAAAVAQDLRDAGWTVTEVGNVRGAAPSTTLYYPDGMLAQAEDVAADLSGAQRAQRASGDLSQEELTVVVTEDVR